MADATAPDATPGAMPDFDALAPATGGMPDFDSLVSPQAAATAERNRRMRGQVDAPLSGPGYDAYYGTSAVGRVLDAFGQGVKEGWGAGPLGLSPETDKALRDAGLFNPLGERRANLTKAFNESIIRPAVTAFDFVQRAGMAALEGGAATIGQAFEETGVAGAVGLPGGQLARDITGMVINEGASTVRLAPPLVAKAQALDVIGAGEAGWLGEVRATRDARASAFAEFSRRADALAEEANAPKPGEAPEAPPAAETPAAPTAPVEDPVHARARQADPATMAQFDALQTRQTTYRRWIDQAAEAQRTAAQDGPEATAAREKISTALDKVGGDETRLTKAAAGRLAQARVDLEAALNPGDTPEMAQIRKALVQADQRIRDLAPAVSEAYRQAREGGVVDGEPPVAPLASEGVKPGEAPRPEEQATSEQPTAQEPAAETAPPAEAKPAIATPEHRAAIADDVSAKLVAAGRPKDEADAAAALVAEHYATRAERFGGAKGTALEMYQRDAPEIQGAEKGGRGGAAAGKTTIKARIGDAIDNLLTLGAHDRFDDGSRSIITLFRRADASTFIHEMGHHFFDELLRDAEDATAPAELVADAKAARAWAGIPAETAVYDIKTRPHEKFARGFERYLYDGVAPSPQLARVFAQFRDWLTRAYRAIKASGTFKPKEISDDIRDVFDRLIARNPERQVGAPKPSEPHAVSDLLAGIHETEAKHVPAGEAKDLGDTIEQEITNAGQSGEPRQPGGGTGGTAGGGGSEAGGGPGAEIPGGGGVGRGAETAEREPAAVGQGAADGTAEGAAARPATPVPTDATQPFAEPASRFIDKAGNIRLDNLSTPEDINQAIRDAAAKNDDFLGARRGVLSDGEVLDLAEAIGMDPAFLDGRKIGQAFNAEQIVAARKLLIQSATAVRDAARAVADDNNDAALRAYAEARTRHIAVQEQVAGITAEAGRALRAFRKLEGQEEAASLDALLKQNTSLTLFQMREEANFAAGLRTPQQVSKFLNDGKAGKIKNGVLTYYINALISGPITHARYSVGNAINALWTPLVEIPTAALISAVKGEEHGVYLAEAKAQLMAMGKGSREGLVAAVEAFRTGQSPPLPSEKIPAQFLDQQGAQAAIPGVAGKIIILPSKSVAAIHSFFKSLRYEQNIHGLAVRTALDEGLEGDALTNRISDLITTPTDTMMEDATKHALRELYMAPTDYHSAAGALVRFTNNSLPAKIIMPFMKIGSQITRNAFIERTPLGLASKEVRSTLLEGGAAQDFQLAKMATGVALIGTMSTLTLEGLATGDGPTDPAKRAIWLMNHKPNTVTVGDVSLPYQGLGSLGMLMRFSANMTETAMSWSEEQGGQLALSFMEGITRSVLDENFMRGLKDMLDAVYHPAQYGPSYIRNFATNWLPFSVGLSQVARQVDPYLRVQNDITSAAWAHIPVLSESLFSNRDRFGEPIPTHGALDRYRNDPVVAEMESLDLGIGKLDRKIRGVPLTDQQYDDYSRIAGRYAKTHLDQIVATPGWHNAPAGVRIDVIHKTIASAREAARSVIMMQNPAIVEAAVKAKIAERQSGKKPPG